MSMTTEHTALTRSICAPAGHLLVGSSDVYLYGLWICRGEGIDEGKFYVVEGEAGEIIAREPTYAMARSFALSQLQGAELTAA